MSAIDFRRVKELARLSAVLHVYDWRPARREPTGLRGPCPIHGGRPGSRSFWVRGGAWYCHGCRRGGSVIDLVAALHHLDDLLEAARETCRLLGLPVPYLARRPQRGARAAADREEDK